MAKILRNVQLITLWLVNFFSLFPMLFFGMSMVSSWWWLNAGVGLVGCWVVSRKLNKFPLINVKPAKKAVVGMGVFTVLTVLVMTSFAWRQSIPLTGVGEITAYQLNTHDGFWHIAIIGALKKSVPPENPLLAGERLVGYHYFLDLGWALIDKVVPATSEFLYLVVGPVLMSALFAVATWMVMMKLFEHSPWAYFGASLLTLGSGLAYVGPWLFKQANFSQSMFWLDQSVAYGLNQPLLMSLIIFNLVVLIFSTDLRHRWWWWAGLLIGSLSGIKIYGLAVLVMASFAVVPVIVLKKEKTWLKALVLAGSISLLVALKLGSSFGFPFFWRPGWFFHSMFEAEARLNSPQFEAMRQALSQSGQTGKVLVWWVGAMLLFLVGNFGVKLIGLGQVFRLLISYFKKGYKNLSKADLSSLWWLSLVFVSFLIPSLFLQKGIVWNTVQHLHYAQLPLVLLSITFLRSFLLSRVSSYSVMATVMILALPTTFMAVAQNLSLQNYQTYPESVVRQLKDLEKLPDSTTIIVGSTLNNSPIVPALSGRVVYWADPGILDILDKNYEDRRLTISRIEDAEREKGSEGVATAGACIFDSVLVQRYEDEILVMRCR